MYVLFRFYLLNVISTCLLTGPSDVGSKLQGDSPHPEGFVGQQVQINALEVLEENHDHQVPGAQYRISLLQTDDHVG